MTERRQLCPLCGDAFCPCVMNAVLTAYIKLPEEMIYMATEETPATALTVTAEITVPLERITNSLIGAFEGGSTYWLRQIEYVDGPIKAENYDGPAYAEESFWHDGGRATLTYDNPEADESDDGDQTSMEIGLPELQKGLVAFALKCPSHFGDLISENDDAITHDCYIQCVLFGDVVYG